MCPFSRTRARLAKDTSKIYLRLQTIYRCPAAEDAMFGHCYDRPWHGHTPPGARAKWGWDANFMSGIFGAEGRGRGRWRSGRMFEQGDLRYVVLRLLEEKPRHGYEI